MKDFLILSLKTPISRDGGSRFYNRKGLSVKGKNGKVKTSGEKGLRGIGVGEEGEMGKGNGKKKKRRNGVMRGFLELKRVGWIKNETGKEGEIFLDDQPRLIFKALNMKQMLAWGGVGGTSCMK
jgi:hypothetical protein